MKTSHIIIAVIIVALGLMVWGSTLTPAIRPWSETTRVGCLPNGHENLALHIHPRLSIFVDGVPEVIPANIGIRPGCMAEVHTHDETGELHVETIDIARGDMFTLQDFFDVWDMELEREGYEVYILRNGQLQDTLSDVPLRDLENLEVRYTRFTTEVHE